MNKMLLTLSLLLLLCPALPARQEAGAISRDAYMAYIRTTAEEGWRGLDSSRKKWYNSIDLDNIWGYTPPGNDIYLAALSVNLYDLTGDQKYLDRARALLVDYGEYKKAYPKDFTQTKAEYAGGLPAVPNIFTLGKYIHAFAGLQKAGALATADRQVIARNIAESADFMLDFQEWGPMNRAMLRAEALLYAAKVLPDHPHRTKWQMLGQAIANDNWGQWEIEDASSYNAIWLYSLLGYASDVREDESLYRTPVMNYNFNYFLALMCPAGIVPDFGDSNWGSGWNRLIPFFEKGAAVYRDPHLRWAAAQIFRKYLAPMPRRRSIFTALCLSDACRWADFSLPAEPPSTKSQQVLDDLVGKKVVFRNGWKPESTYLLHNYRDEGDGGWLFREYLRTTIPVEEEKMHHGHSDENSIALLMHANTVLLHDGGYRDYMPSGPFGAYRADYYHNRLCVRNGKIALGQKTGERRYASPAYAAVPGQHLLDFLRNSGAHQPVRTQKIDFLTLQHFDMSRTRLIDDRLGYEWDRIINYIKDLDLFVIFDVLRFTRPGYLTAANLWHTRKIIDRGEGWYTTTYDSLRTIDVSGDGRLLIYFPHRSARLTEGVEEETRYYQNEKIIYQMIGRHGYRNDLQAFVTVLYPHKDPKQAAAMRKNIHLLDGTAYPKAAGVVITANDSKYILGAKLDMQAELIRDWRRPMYNYASGKTTYGDYETDAYHFFAVESEKTIHYAISGAVKILYKGRVLHEQMPAEFGLRFDGGPDVPGVGKLRYWEEDVRK